jgi:hypothetical protein
VPSWIACQRKACATRGFCRPPACGRLDVRLANLAEQAVARFLGFSPAVERRLCEADQLRGLDLRPLVLRGRDLARGDRAVA